MSQCASHTYYIVIIKTFFKTIDRTSFKKVADIINRNSPISLRLIEWFVTNYAKVHKIRYSKDGIDKPLNETYNAFDRDIYVYSNYKSKLKAYGKNKFDPFRRDGNKFDFTLHGITITTTLRQLNFFKWVIQDHILSYIEKHFSILKECMVKDNNGKKHRKSNVIIKPQEDVSLSTTLSFK